MSITRVLKRSNEWVNIPNSYYIYSKEIWIFVRKIKTLKILNDGAQTAQAFPVL